MKYKFGFVILHYITIEDTKKCVNSILKKVNNPIIVIVDNHSPNDTGEKLFNEYINKENVIVVVNEKNLGFANGNNVGIKLLMEKFNCKFITVMNNDTKILSNNYEKIVEKEYNNSHFSVLGPQIITKDNCLKTNPVEFVIDSSKMAKKVLIKKMCKYVLVLIGLGRLLNETGKGIKYKGVYDNEKRYENIKLHGACWVLSDIFLNQSKYLNKSTFLYFEEDILFNEQMKKGLKTVYNPKLKIYHDEDSSTNALNKTKRNKELFVLKNEIKSLMVLYKLLKKR